MSNNSTWQENYYFKIRDTFELSGYKPYRMRKFEEYSLYADNHSFLTSEYIITFTDTDGKLLALKPDVTLSILKNTKANENVTEKLYYKENVYRLDKHSGEYKEINQIGLECIGKIDVLNVIEIIELALASLAATGKSYILDISDMGIINSLFDYYRIEESVRAAIVEQMSVKSIDGLKRVMDEYALSVELTDKLVRLLNSPSDYDSALNELRALSVTDSMKGIVNKFTAIKEVFDGTEYKGKLRLDFSTINNTGYYNGIIMQGYVDGVSKVVLYGGQYDKLVEKFRKNLSAMGFALYVDELQYIQEAKSESVDVLIVYNGKSDYRDVLKLARELREGGESVRIDQSEPSGLLYGQKIIL